MASAICTSGTSTHSSSNEYHKKKGIHLRLSVRRTDTGVFIHGHDLRRGNCTIAEHGKSDIGVSVSTPAKNTAGTKTRLARNVVSEAMWHNIERQRTCEISSDQFSQRHHFGSRAVNQRTVFFKTMSGIYGRALDATSPGESQRHGTLWAVKQWKRLAHYMLYVRCATFFDTLSREFLMLIPRDDQRTSCLHCDDGSNER